MDSIYGNLLAIKIIWDDSMKLYKFNSLGIKIENVVDQNIQFKAGGSAKY